MSILLSPQPCHVVMMPGTTTTPHPPHLSEVHADMACLASQANVLTDIHVFGYRVHTHELGAVVSGYTYDTQVRPGLRLGWVRLASWP